MLKNILVNISFFLLLVLNVYGQKIGATKLLPIKPSRLLSFHTKEGSYMNIDVSRNGRLIAFDLLGDIFIMPSKGGEARQITRGIALHIKPIWSPDGTKIAYLSDSLGFWNVYTHNFSTGKKSLIKTGLQVLTDKTDILWLNNRQLNVSEDQSIVVGNENILSISARTVLKIDNENRILFYIDSQKVAKYDIGNKKRDILANSSWFFHNYQISQDNQYLAYISQQDSTTLIVKDLKTSEIMRSQRLVFNDPAKKSDNQLLHYSFSGDSKHIFISFSGQIHKLGISDKSDHVIQFSAKPQVSLGSLNNAQFSLSESKIPLKYLRSGSTSVDGRYIVFTALSKMYLNDLKENTIKKVLDTKIPQYQPCLSHDGKWITFVSWDDKEGGSLWKVHISGRNLTQLETSKNQYAHPVWSPDGKSIAVIKGLKVLNDRDDYGNGTLKLINLSEGKSKVIADSVPLLNNVAFSSLGDKLYYTPGRFKFQFNKQQAQLVATSIGGDTHTEILAVGEDVSWRSSKMLSPDGRFIVFSLFENVYVVPYLNTGKPVVLSEIRDEVPGIVDNLYKASGIKLSEGIDPVWDYKGQNLHWLYANRYYSVSSQKLTKNLRAATPSNVTLKINSTIEKGKGIVVFKNAKIITMLNKRVIPSGNLVIVNGRIKTIGKNARIPTNARVFDLKGKVIMPGIIDLHDHMRVISDIFPQQSWMFLANLAYGVTTARDPSASYDSFGYSELISTGNMIGPRLLTVGRPARLVDGVLGIDNQLEAVKFVKKRKEMGGISIKQYNLPTRMWRQRLLLACKKLKLNMTNEGDFGWYGDLAMIKDGSAGIEHSPQWGDVGNDIIRFIAKSGTVFTPTLQVGHASDPAKEYFNYKYWKSPDAKIKRFTLSDSSRKKASSLFADTWEIIQNAKYKDTLHPSFVYGSKLFNDIRKLNGPVALGSHGNDEGIGAHNELWALQLGGLTNEEALEAATIIGAKALGLEKDLGSIEVGKIADLIILNKDPLQDIHNSREIKYVMKQGVLYDGNTLDEIWPVKRKCPEWKMK